MQGSVTVPPCDTAHWKLSAGANEDAAAAELIVLGTAYEQAWPLLEAIAPQIRGKGKTILDMTNPFLKRPDGFGAGLPKDGPQARTRYPGAHPAQPLHPKPSQPTQP
jgi:predicted dinucleotide-binding enzyme